MNIVTPVDCFTGYGITGYNIWKHIYKRDDSTALFTINSLRTEDDWEKSNLSKSINNQSKFDPSKPCVKIWHAQDLIMKPYGQSKYGALTFFETDTISNKEKLGYEILDVIFAASGWAKGVLQNNNIKRDIVVCPQGVDTHVFDAHIPDDKPSDKFIFINIGKWEIRKGHDKLSEIFNRAFSSEDNVELWMINTNPFLNSEEHNSWINLYKNSVLGDKIRIFPRLPSQKILSKVMSYADCGVFPSRAEGWNNEAIEIMAMNKPIIITNYSAHTEYCNSSNAYLVNIGSLEPARDNMWFDGSGKWAHLGTDEIDQFVEHMRYVYKYNIRTNPKGLETAKTFSWDKTAKIIEQNLS
jgi:glycosyltransferase involved in cell wall biosynthesis